MYENVEHTCSIRFIHYIINIIIQVVFSGWGLYDSLYEENALGDK